MAHWRSLEAFRTLWHCTRRHWARGDLVGRQPKQEAQHWCDRHAKFPESHQLPTWATGMDVASGLDLRAHRVGSWACFLPARSRLKCGPRTLRAEGCQSLGLGREGAGAEAAWPRKELRTTTATTGAGSHSLQSPSPAQTPAWHQVPPQPLPCPCGAAAAAGGIL